MAGTSDWVISGSLSLAWVLRLKGGAAAKYPSAPVAGTLRKNSREGGNGGRKRLPHLACELLTGWGGAALPPVSARFSRAFPRLPKLHRQWRAGPAHRFAGPGSEAEGRG